MTTQLGLHRAFIRISGPDASPFLDNLLTQDVAKLGETGVEYAALLSPQGKLIADMALWADGDAVLIETDPARSGDLLRRLSMYKLRARVEIADATQSQMALWSPEPFPGAAPDPRLPSLGWRKLAAPAEAAPGGDAFDAHRLALGVPDLARDAAPEEVFAGEALLEELNGVAFHKGCFVGQENVSRMKRRATTRKKFCPVRFDGAAPAFGTPVLAGDVDIGSVRTGMPERAIALLRLDRALAGEPLTIDGRPASLDPPPWLILPPSGASQS